MSKPKTYYLTATTKALHPKRITVMKGTEEDLEHMRACGKPLIVSSSKVEIYDGKWNLVEVIR